jgi:Ca-activated chloride channel family protein
MNARICRAIALLIATQFAIACTPNNYSGGNQTELSMEKRSGSTPTAEEAPAPSQSLENNRYDKFLAEGDNQFNREQYDRIVENDFQLVQAKPLSTFSIDVDSASYSNTRRFINNGQLPPKDAVRIEEFINYFTYDYPNPQGDRPFSMVTEISEAPWNRAHKLVHIGLQGKRLDTENLPPSNLVFLLDVSGSMNSPNKLPLLKSAFQLLLDELGEGDRVAIVVYAGAAGVALPSTPATEQETILEALNTLSAGGTTAGGEGIKRAYKVARENFIESGNNRVILATDGDFNVGVSSDAALVRLIEQKRKQGIFLTVLGFGTGNLQDAKMEKLADKGNGNYAYIDSILEAKKVLVKEIGATLLTIAKDVKIQVEFNPAKVAAYRLIGYENRQLQAQDFSDDTKDAGELGAGHSVTALYEVIPVGANTNMELPSVDELEYQQTEIDASAYETNELMQVKLRYKQPDASESQLMVQPVVDAGVRLDTTSENFRFSAAVAGFGMLLRDSKYKGDMTFEKVLELAQESQGEDANGYRAEFLQLVESSRLLNEN